MKQVSEFTAINALNKNNYHVVIENDVVVSYNKIPTSSSDSLFFIPGGLVDTQVNGYLGYDYSADDFSMEQANIVSIELAKRGTLQHFPTIVTRPQGTIVRNIKEIVKAVKTYPQAQNSITGIHVEGPYISPNDGPRGAHDSHYVRKASITEFDQWLEASEGLLKVVTLAPEIENAEDLIAHAVKNNVTVSIGHSGANKREIQAGINAGASVSTHLGNGIYAKLDRFDNPIWPQLVAKENYISVIADGAHVDPDLVKIFSMCKDSDHIILVSDLATVAGNPIGKKIKWGSLDVEIAPDGSVRLSGTPYLAAAGSLLIENLFKYQRFTGADVYTSAKLCSINPINAYNLTLSRTDVKLGQIAELILFDNNKCSLEKIYSKEGELL